MATPPPLRFVGLLVERKTDVLALTAFLISATTITINIWALARGPEVRVVNPGSYVLFENVCYEAPFIQFVFNLSYINAASKDFSDTLLEEYAVIRISGDTYGFSSEFIGETSSSSKFDTLENVDCGRLIGNEVAALPGMVVRQISEPHPVQLQGASGFGHTVVFTPYQKLCSEKKVSCDSSEINLTVEKIVNELTTNEKIVVFLFSRFAVDGLKLAKCEIKTNAPLVEWLPEGRWASQECYVTDVRNTIDAVSFSEGDWLSELSKRLK